MRTYLEKRIHIKRAGGVAQDVGPELEEEDSLETGL
jgi:hypothetical protein